MELVEGLRGSDSHIVWHVTSIHIFEPSDSKAGKIHILTSYYADYDITC